MKKTRFVSGIFFVLVLALVTFGTSFGCSGDDGDDSAASSGDLVIDRTSLAVIPPAGVRVTFRVTGDDGSPIDTLTNQNVKIINDENNEPFGQGLEGGSVSDVGPPVNFGLYSVLALDMSDSIFNSGSADDVISGARAFIRLLVEDPEPQFKHRVALIALGRPEEVELVQSFSQDADALYETLDQLASSASRGSTDLYGAYMMALDVVEDGGADMDLVERFVVLLTDGTHEAGDEKTLRNQALAKKDDSTASIFSIGIQGNYDESRLRELASKSDYFVPVEDASQLTSVFSKVANRVEQIARSNYVVGICTPVSSGAPSLTIEIKFADKTASETLTYSGAGLTGDVTSCNPEEIVNPCGFRECGSVPGLSDVDCGTCSGDLYCYDGVCEEFDDCAQDFEDGSLPSGWSTYGNANWRHDSSTASSGSGSFRSGNIHGNQNSSLTFDSGDMCTSTLFFDFSVSSEPGYDYLAFYVDGDPVDSWSGQQGWTTYEYSFDGSGHRFTWEYYKDGSVSNGSDAAWIDNVLFY